MIFNIALFIFIFLFLVTMVYLDIHERMKKRRLKKDEDAKAVNKDFIKRKSKASNRRNRKRR